MGFEGTVADGKASARLIRRAEELGVAAEFGTFTFFLPGLGCPRSFDCRQRVPSSVPRLSSRGPPKKIKQLAIMVKTLRLVQFYCYAEDVHRVPA